MKMLFIYFCLFPLFVYHACTTGRESSVQSSQNLKPELKDTIYFTAQVQPILENRCSPCHFPGGKMYERMPFDKDTTIINHQASILKRIKTEEENAVIKKFVLQNEKE